MRTQSGEARVDDAGLVRSSGVVAVGTLLSRVTGLARTIILAFALGSATVSVATSYNLANNTPNMIYDLLLGGILSATLVPVLVSNRERRDDVGTDAVVTVASVVLVVISVLAVLLAPAIVRLYDTIAGAGQRPPTASEIALATTLLRLFAPQVLFYGLTTLATSVLNAHRRFAAAAFAPVVNNVVLIGVLLLAWHLIANPSDVDAIRNDRPLVLLLGLGTTAGIAAMAAVLWPAMVRAGIALRWRLDFRHPAVAEVARLSGWTLGYVIANQITQFVLISLAFGSARGVSAWNYGYQFFQLPYGVFTVSVMTAFTPELAALASRHAHREFNERFLFGFRLVMLVLLPATVLFVVLAGPIVSDLLVHGNFRPSDAPATVSTVAGLAWGMVGFSTYLYILRAFYARKDTRTPFLVNLLENALTLVFAFVFVQGFDRGVEGLAWAWSLAYTVSAVVALVTLRARVGPFGRRAAVGTTAPVARMALAAAVMAVAVVIVATVLPAHGPGAWATVVVGAAVGIAVYGLLLALMGVREIRDVPRMLLRR